MSSGFVSGGTTDAPIERDDKWLAVQLEIERERQERKDREKAVAEGKSLFETLEANKGAFPSRFFLCLANLHSQPPSKKHSKKPIVSRTNFEL